MARARPRLVAAAALLALAGCSYLGLGHELPHEQGPTYSPNGEPLSGGPLGGLSCADALRRWLARVDANHDGTIDPAEFLADANRQFAAMDLDKSGVLTPSVLARYRLPYLALPPRDEKDADERERERRRRGDAEPPIGLDRADPVMLADASLRNRVTRDEFLSYARRNFATLDRNRDGRLDADELVSTCKE